MMNYYQPSGKFSPVSFVWLALLSVTVLPLLGLIYSYAIWYIPFIYINFFVTVIFGALAGFAVNYFVIGWAKVRNPKLALLFGVLAGLAALYFSWVVWLDLAMNMGENYGSERIGITVSNIKLTEVLQLAFDPAMVVKLAALINLSGTWGIRGATVSGVFLAIIWGLEAAIVVFVPALLTVGRAKKPFCEETNVWASEKELPAIEYIEDAQALKASLESGNCAILREIGKAQSTEDKHSLFTLYYTPAETYFLSITNKLPKVDSKGKTSFDSQELVEYVMINRETGKQLMAKE
jgi:hypothetical protein